MRKERCACLRESPTIHDPVSDAGAVLADSDHAQVVDAHRVVFVWWSELRGQCFVSFLLFALILDFPGNVYDLLDVGVCELPVYELAKDDELQKG